MQFHLKRFRAEDVGSGEVPVETVAVEETKQVTKKSWSAMKVVALAISLLANAMSVYYSYAWFSAYLPVVGALTMASIMVACISLAPQFVIILSERGTKRNFAASIIISLVAIPSAIFSMGATVGGLYNQRSKAVIERSSMENAADVSAIRESAIRERIAKIKSDIEIATKEESLYWERYTALSNAALGSRSEALLLDRVESARKRIESLNASLEVASSDLSKIDRPKTVERDDFYTWLGNRLGIDVDSMEFILSAFPAVFIDVIAPTMLAVSVFL